MYIYQSYWSIDLDIRFYVDQKAKEIKFVKPSQAIFILFVKNEMLSYFGLFAFFRIVQSRKNGKLRTTSHFHQRLIRDIPALKR